MKGSRGKRSISFILAVLMLILTVGESGINIYAKDSIVEETVVSEELSFEEVVVEEVMISEETPMEEMETESEDINSETEPKDTFVEEVITEEEINSQEILSEKVEAKEAFSENMLNDIIPELVVYEAFDKYISLGLSVPEEFIFPENETFYYEVKVILNRENEIKENIFLFEKEESRSQNAVIEMQEGFMGEDENWTYKIEVKLVSNQETDNFEMGVMEVMTQESQTSFLNDIEVKPYYETKMTLKKKTAKMQKMIYMDM